MQKIHEMRDGHIFKGLATLCAAGTSLEAAAKVAKDTVQRIGSKGFVGEFAKWVWLSTQALRCYAQHVACCMFVCKVNVGVPLLCGHAQQGTCYVGKVSMVA